MRTKISVLILSLFVSINVYAGDVYVRDDGDNIACDGTVDAPKTSSGKCAFKTYYSNYVFKPDSKDAINIRKGSYVVRIQQPDIWVTRKDFNKNPDQYLTALLSGRKVFISDLNGIPYEIMLRKY